MSKVVGMDMDGRFNSIDPIICKKNAHQFTLTFQAGYSTPNTEPSAAGAGRTGTAGKTGPEDKLLPQNLAPASSRLRVEIHQLVGEGRHQASA